MNDRQPIIEFKQVNFKYQSQAEPNLIDISFAIYPGETVLIIGPSGSGKSTLAKCINGQVPYSYDGDLTGEILIQGKSTKDVSLFDLSLSIGTVLQDTDGQFVGLTVAEDIAFSLENDVVDQHVMKKQVSQWMNELDIEELHDHTPHQLSGGQKQRVSIAGVLIDQVPILLFDEPLANLDPASGYETMRLIDRLSQRQNLTTVIIEHRLEEALSTNVDRILVMHDGHLIANMTPDALLRSDILESIGVRQPLYLDLLDYAGIDLASIKQLGAFRPDMLNAEQRQTIASWTKTIHPPINTPASQSLIEVKQLSFAYDEDARSQTLANVNFSIAAGEMVSIVGSNGAGKSTLAKLLGGFLRPTHGDIYLKGQNIRDLSIKEIADSIGYVMQNPNHMISKNLIFDEVALGLVNRGVDAEEIETRVYNTLKICGLYPFRQWPISALSYGQKRRVTIASILVLQPSVMILDEPTAGQDYAHYSDMMRFLETINQEYQMTILMISHDMHLIQEYTTRSLVFSGGQLLADLAPSELFARKELIEEADLHPTSLYQVGALLPDVSINDLLKAFIAYERQQRGREVDPT
ncbi:ABC transporter ATP-binding protein [Fundicoccus culcitae]|uniref:ABC transporter ATP-binding protein n=1 Tax=Fundicoccus culcitae TaxID=2969821 RepID=A0ABY5P526_9LACT|nr:ABC transporter ATP-binding protein [Fundicoccus culcitae]UUX33676.1 ABC transporter ATP-binding protein [Fundicoccus culcitae]